MYNVIKPSSDLITLVFILPIDEQSTNTYPSGSISLSLKILFEQTNDNSNMSLQQKLENSGSDPIYSSDSETENDNKTRVVFFGAGSWTPKKGSPAVPRKPLISRIASKGLCIVEDEYRTSKCS